MSIIHCVIQLFLTTILGENSDLEARIAIFCYIATAFPVILILLTTGWSLHLVGRTYDKALILLLFLIAAYNLRSGNGYHLVIPDYYIWSIPLSLIGFGFATRQLENNDFFAQNWFYIALYASACFTLKPTYMVIPLVIGLLPLCSSSFIKWLMAVIKIAVTSFLLAYTILIIYYKGDVYQAWNHFDLSTYQQFAINDFSFRKWWLKSTTYGFDITLITMILPCLLVCSIFFKKVAKTSIILLMISSLNLIIAYQRPYPPTFVELANISIMILAIWAYQIKLAYPWYWKSFNFPMFHVALLPVLSFVLCIEVFNFYQIFIPEYKKSEAAAMVLSDYLLRHKSKTLFLIPDNHYRPLTLDTAVYKGGMNINNLIWPQSSLVSSYVPDRSFLVSIKNPAIRINAYDNLIFVVPENQEVAFKQRISNMFDVDFSKYSCDFKVNQGYGGTNWFLPYVKAHINPNSRMFPEDGHIAREIIVCRKDI